MTYRLLDPNDERLRSLQIFLLCAAVIRGFDFLIRPEGTSWSLSAIEAAFPLWVWGALYITFGVVGLLGEWWMHWGAKRTHLIQEHIPAPLRNENRWWPSYTAHSVLCALYAASGAGLIIGLFQEWHIWGIAVAVERLGFAVGHWVFVRGRRDAN